MRSGINMRLVVQNLVEFDKYRGLYSRDFRYSGVLGAEPGILLVS